MSAPKKREPLTAAQQATVTQWHPLACKYTLKALHGRGLGHYEDEAEGLAADALMGAVNVWEPRRGSFASCLKWWVLAVVNVFRTHGARVVHQAEHATELLPTYTLDAPVTTGPLISHPMTWLDLLEAAPDDVSGAVDATRLYRAAEVVVTRRLVAESGGRLTPEMAANFYSVWVDRKTGEDETPMHFIGWAWGVSRQMAQQRVARVEAAFESWAAEIRKEAA